MDAAIEALSSGNGRTSGDTSIGVAPGILAGRPRKR
jgi:hypothetical protein